MKIKVKLLSMVMTLVMLFSITPVCKAYTRDENLSEKSSVSLYKEGWVKKSINWVRSNKILVSVSVVAAVAISVLFVEHKKVKENSILLQENIETMEKAQFEKDAKDVMIKNLSDKLEEEIRRGGYVAENVASELKKITESKPKNIIPQVEEVIKGLLELKEEVEEVLSGGDASESEIGSDFGEEVVNPRDTQNLK